MNWTVFASIYGQVDAPLLSAIQTIVGNMLSAVSAILNAAMTVYVALVGYMIATGRAGEPMTTLAIRCAKGAGVALFLTAATYNQYVTTFFLTTMPNAISSAVTGGTTVGASAFDTIWNTAFAGGLAVWRNLGTFDFGQMVVVALYWLIAAVSIAYGFLVWLASHIILGLFVIFGPIAIVCYLFGPTRALMERWIGALISVLLLQLFVTATLSVVLTAEKSLLSSVVANSGNPWAQIQVLFSAVILFLVAYDVVKQLPGAATALAGGMYFHANSIGRATFGAAASYASSAAGAVGGRVAAAPAAARARLMQGPPGPSMSGVRP